MVTHRRFNPQTLFVLLALALLPGIGKADILELKDGTLLKGSYAGGTPETIRFVTAEGARDFPRNQAATLTFAAPAPPPAPAAAPAPAIPPTPPAPAAAAPAPRQVTVAAGTMMLVRMETQVSSDNKAGTRFTGKLESDLATVDGVVVAPAGTKVVGKVAESKKAGRMAGKSKLQLCLTELNLNGKLIPIVTSDYSEAGDSSFKKTARNTAVGAGAGALIDGGEGAKTGAAVGLAASVIRKGESVTIPPNAVLEFRLTQPLQITAAQ